MVDIASIIVAPKMLSEPHQLKIPGKGVIPQPFRPSLKPVGMGHHRQTRCK